MGQVMHYKTVFPLHICIMKRVKQRLPLSFPLYRSLLYTLIYLYTWDYGRAAAILVHRALADIDEHVEEGHVYDIIVKVRETRISNLVSNILIGLSVQLIPRCVYRHSRLKAYSQIENTFSDCKLLYWDFIIGKAHTTASTLVTRQKINDIITEETLRWLFRRVRPHMSLQMYHICKWLYT